MNKARQVQHALQFQHPQFSFGFIMSKGAEGFSYSAGLSIEEMLTQSKFSRKFVRVYLQAQKDKISEIRFALISNKSARNSK